MGDQTVDYLKRLWNSGMPTTISGDHVFVESGTKVVTTFASGQGISGKPVTISGDHVFVESGVWIAGLSFSGLDIEVNISGDPVNISGQPVIISGQPVIISGQHVHLESGDTINVFVKSGSEIAVISGTPINISGQPVIISGQPVTISGDHVYVESGARVVTTFASGQGFSGTPLVVSSGLHVWISGQHVFQESGAFVTTQPGIQVSGLVDVEVLSGQIHILSGIITVESGLHVMISGQPVTISGDHVFVESGIAHIYAFDGTSGFASGVWRPIAICGSGEIIVCSGLHVVADIAESGLNVVISGQPVTISGDHVYVESGARVVTTFASGQGVSGAHVIISGQPVTISGDHVYVESGARVVTTFASGQGFSGTPLVVSSGLHVWISGQHVYMESGAHVVGDFTTEVESGLHVIISGQPVTISGDHVFVESGARVVTTFASGQGTDQTTASGQIIHVGCAGTIRTGKLLQLEGGMSGHTLSGVPTASGGISLCNVSGDFCSGPIHTIIVKNLADNDAVYVGEVNCRPYSGYGFLLAATEAINLDYCSICDVWVWAQTSGQYITWIATDY